MAAQSVANSGKQSTSRGGENPQSSSSSETAQQPLDDLICYAKDYARQQPEMAALWCLGIGFILGWKLKPW